MSKECDEYIDFVTKKIQNAIDHEYSIQGRNVDTLIGYNAKIRIAALKDLADELGVMVK